MATRKENLQALASNTRARLIVIFIMVVVFLGIAVGIVHLQRAASPIKGTGASAVSNAPSGIESIPGAIHQTQQYVKLQSEQNIQQAKHALVSGESAIPTIVESQAFGAGVQAVGPQGGTGGVGFRTLSREEEGSAESLWLDALRKAHCSRAAVNTALSQGAGLAALREACGCSALKPFYDLKELQPYCSCPALKQAGFNATELKSIGYDATQLKRCGFTACDLHSAGFTAEQLRNAGFSDGELQGAGYSATDIKQSEGLPPGVTLADVRKAGCSAKALTHLREEGVSAAAIRRISGCSATQLKAAGFSAQQLKDAGFTAAELAKAGFSPATLKAAGFSARDLLNAGFTPTQLAEAGFSKAEIHAAETELPPGYTPLDVKSAGCSQAAIKRERMAGMSAALIHQYAGCSAAQLKAAGFTASQLADAGFTPEQLLAAGFTPAEIAAAGGNVSDAAIKAAGCDAAKLHQLLEEGVSAARIHQLNGCSATQLKEAGFTANQLANAGFTPEQLMAAGFTPAELDQAGALSSTQGCSAASLRAAYDAGVSAATIRQTLGCGAAAMKAAGYSATQLRDAGYTAAELKNAGFSAEQLKAAGFSAQALRDAGFSAKQLRDAGYSLADLKAAGFNAADLRAAGYTPAQLKGAGFSAKALRRAGFSAQELKDAGYSDATLNKAGFTAEELKSAGIPLTTVAGLPTPPPAVSGMSALPGLASDASSTETAASNNTKQLQSIVNRQNEEMAAQRYQQNIQNRAASMLASANQSMQGWKTVSTQAYEKGHAVQTKDEANQSSVTGAPQGLAQHQTEQGPGRQKEIAVKAGDILFAVLDNAVNSDEPSPILATIVSGRLNGAKLIGSFTLPSNANKMVITFNTISVPGTQHTNTINAYAIDADTARTALSSRTDHHYLSRYGSLFAASFLQGFGNAFQSANTTVTVGGTGGGNDISVQNGIGRSALENAVIGLAQVGQSWGQVAQQNVNQPVTVEVYAGLGIGVLFTQDVFLPE